MENSRFDTLLYMASEYMTAPEVGIYDSADDAVELSRRYLRRMNRFIRGVKRRESLEQWSTVLRYAKRTAVAVMLICTVGLGCVLGIKATREALWKLIITRYDKSIKVTFVPDNTSDTEVSANAAEDLSETAAETLDVMSTVPTEILDYREPAECLVGFDRYEINRSFASLLIEYEKEDILITYSQHLIGDYATYVSNQDTVVSDIEINGYIGICGEFTIQGIDFCVIIWRDGEYEYSLEGNVPFEELLKMSESVQSVN